jgi:hypothetical protein
MQNKNKSKSVQKYVQSVAAQVKNTGKKVSGGRGCAARMSQAARAAALTRN